LSYHTQVKNLKLFSDYIIATDRMEETTEQKKVSTYTDYYRNYYQTHKSEIWERVKQTQAYKDKYKNYYNNHKEELNKKRMERYWRKKKALAESTATAPSSLVDPA
jgi:F0F1-type ATP synthase alpha subunit